MQVSRRGTGQARPVKRAFDVPRIVIAGASFDEALAVVQFQSDAALAPVAAALGVQ